MICSIKILISSFFLEPIKVQLALDADSLKALNGGGAEILSNPATSGIGNTDAILSGREAAEKGDFGRFGNLAELANLALLLKTNAGILTPTSIATPPSPQPPPPPPSPPPQQVTQEKELGTLEALALGALLGSNSRKAVADAESLTGTNLGKN